MTSASTPAAKAMAALHALLVLFVVASAVYVWRIRCEGFGCTGVGIAWFSWAVIFVAVLLLGWITRQLTRTVIALRRSVQVLMAVQLVVGVFLLATWGLRHAG